MTLVGTRIKTIELEERPDTYSHSKVKSFLKCSRYYKNNYIDRIKVYKDSNSTILGTFIHSALEYLYDDHDDEINSLFEAFEHTSLNDLYKLGIREPEIFVEQLDEYLKDEDHLRYLASEECEGDHCIRTKAGKVAKVPSMTTKWKEMERQLDLGSRRHLIDQTFITKVGQKACEVSITEAYSTARHLAKQYKTPNVLEEIRYIEFPISQWVKETNELVNPISFPLNNETIFVTGFIDLVCYVELDGVIYNAIIDHKTSKEKFVKESVKYNAQLNLYAYLFELLTGETVDYIGINAIRDNDLVLAPVDSQVKFQIVKNFIETIKATKHGNYISYFPEGQYAPCLDMFGKNCPYLETCHPEFAESLTLVDLL